MSGWCLTHRLSLADQKLVELLQQGRLPDDLPAHVGVPGLLIGVPGEDTHSVYPVFLVRACVSFQHWVNHEILPAQSLRSLNLLAIDLHLLNILKVFFLQTVEDFLGMAGTGQKGGEIVHVAKEVTINTTTAK